MTDIKYSAKKAKGNNEIVIKIYAEQEPRSVSPYQEFHLYGRVLN